MVEVSQFRVERAAEDILLSANLKFELPLAVEDAMLKGIPVFFVVEAEVFRDRWYWTDKKLISAERHMRLVYQPLTRRWRLGVSSGVIASNGLGVVLNQMFDNIEEAMATVKRLSGWRIGDVTEIDKEGGLRVEFRFRLDTAQLPRPLQIGVMGHGDWTIAAKVAQAIGPESLK